MSRTKITKVIVEDNNKDEIIITKQKTVKKDKIPATLRNSIWNLYIGSDTKTGKCFCCDTETISTANFECGHILSEKEGGEITINNLRPICSLCNKSMGIQHMELFMKKHGFEKNKNWSGIKKKVEEEHKLKTILKKNQQQTYVNLNLKEIQLIGKILDIKDKNKNKIIENIINTDFSYDEWFSTYVDQLTNDKLKVLCKYLKLNVKKNKQKTKEMLSSENIQIYMMEDIINEIKNSKYFVECCGDKTKSCIHCKKCEDEIILQCERCDNSHTFTTNNNICIHAYELSVQCDYYWLKNKCEKCNANTTQFVYNNPFYNFIDKNEKLIFDDISERKIKEIIKNNTDVKNDINTDVKNNINTDVKNDINTDVKNDINTDVKNDINTDVKNDDSEINKLNDEIKELKEQLYKKDAFMRHAKFDVDENNLKLELDEPNNRCLGENKSKLLLPGSELFNYITKIKKILRHNGFNHHDRMGLHTEVLNDNSENINDFLKRIKILEGKLINIYDPNNYIIQGGAIALKIGTIEGYKKIAKITIAFFDNGRTHDAYLCLLKNI
jgi:hypothetical protein